MTKLYLVCFVFLATHFLESASQYNNYKLDFVPSPRDPREIYPGNFNKDGRVFYYHFAPPYEKMKKFKKDDGSRKKIAKIQVVPERRLEVIFVNFDYPKPELVIHPPPKKKLQIYLLGNKNNLERNKYIESPEVPRHVPEVFFLRNLKKSTAKSKHERPFTILREDDHYADEEENQNHLHGVADGLFEQVDNFYNFHDATELHKQSAHIQNFENYETNYPLPPSPVSGGNKYSVQDYAYGSPPSPAFVLPPGYPDERY